MRCVVVCVGALMHVLVKMRVLGCVYLCVSACVGMGVEVCVVWLRMCVVGGTMASSYVGRLTSLKHRDLLAFPAGREAGPEPSPAP